MGSELHPYPPSMLIWCNIILYVYRYNSKNNIFFKFIPYKWVENERTKVRRQIVVTVVVGVVLVVVAVVVVVEDRSI